MATVIALNDGSLGHDYVPLVVGPSGSIPKADTLPIVPNETLGQMTQRAYGANTSALRARIEHANASLDGAVVGEIRAPR